MNDHMDRKILSLFFALATCVGAFAQNSDFLDYIEKYKRLAIMEMERAGVPASIKMAQAILESNAGRSELARRANNHFGIKCGNDWSGKTFHREDDDFDEFGNLIKSCFRSYRHAEDSYIAHSEFLRDPRKAHRYGFLFRLDPTDYQRWARGLRTSGYATSATYDANLIRIIETYKLYELDRMTSKQLPGVRPERNRDLIAGLDVQRVNDVRVVVATPNLTVQEISLRSDISVSRLNRYNEMLPPPFDTLTRDYRVFLQPKRARFRGRQKWHYVHENETMFDISQQYAVKLVRLQRRNRVPAGAEPQASQRIKLKGCRIKEAERPRLLNEPAPVTVPPTGGDGGTLPEVSPTTPTTPAPQPTTPDSPSTPTADAVYYTVVKGDTLFGISRRYGISVDELMKLNNLSNTTISIGQVLRVK